MNVLRHGCSRRTALKLVGAGAIFPCVVQERGQAQAAESALSMLAKFIESGEGSMSVPAPNQRQVARIARRFPEFQLSDELYDRLFAGLRLGAKLGCIRTPRYEEVQPCELRQPFADAIRGSGVSCGMGANALWVHSIRGVEVRFSFEPRVGCGLGFRRLSFYVCGSGKMHNPRLVRITTRHLLQSAQDVLGSDAKVRFSASSYHPVNPQWASVAEALEVI